MNSKNADLTRTPLRNSYLANKPFCSPMRSDITPVKNVKNDLKRLLSPSPSPNAKLLTPSREVIKRRKIDVSESENIFSPKKNHQDSEPTYGDFLALKSRIRIKKLEIESLKTKLAYRKKNNQEDLHIDIKKWREACQQALIQYQKDCSDKLDNGKTLEMDEILKMLGIPEHIVKFPNEDY